MAQSVKLQTPKTSIMKGVRNQLWGNLLHRAFSCLCICLVLFMAADCVQAHVCHVLQEHRASVSVFSNLRGPHGCQRTSAMSIHHHSIFAQRYMYSSITIVSHTQYSWWAMTKTMLCMPERQQINVYNELNVSAETNKDSSRPLSTWLWRTPANWRGLLQSFICLAWMWELKRTHFVIATMISLERRHLTRMAWYVDHCWDNTGPEGACFLYADLWEATTAYYCRATS